MFGSLGSTCTFHPVGIGLAEDFHTSKLLESFVGLLIVRSQEFSRRYCLRAIAFRRCYDAIEGCIRT